MRITAYFLGSLMVLAFLTIETGFCQSLPKIGSVTGIVKKVDPIAGKLTFTVHFPQWRENNEKEYRAFVVIVNGESIVRIGGSLAALGELREGQRIIVDYNDKHATVITSLEALPLQVVREEPVQRKPISKQVFQPRDDPYPIGKTVRLGGNTPPPSSVIPTLPKNKPMASSGEMDYGRLYEDGVIRRKLPNSAGDRWAKYLATLSPEQRTIVMAEAQRQYNDLTTKPVVPAVNRDEIGKNLLWAFWGGKDPTPEDWADWRRQLAGNLRRDNFGGSSGGSTGSPSNSPSPGGNSPQPKNTQPKQPAAKSPPQRADPPQVAQSRITGVVYQKDGSVAKNIEVKGVWGGVIDHGVTTAIRTDDRGRFTLTWNNGRWLNRIWVEVPGFIGGTEEVSRDIQPGSDIIIRLKKG